MLTKIFLKVINDIHTYMYGIYILGGFSQNDVIWHFVAIFHIYKNVF